MQKLIIVCTKETEQYGQYLMQLIGQKDDDEVTTVGLKDGSVDAVLWAEKDYTQNRPTLPSSAYVLFIGDSKLMQREASNMEKRYNRFGMQFLSLGTHAVMRVEEKMLSKKDYDGFAKECEECKKKLEEKVNLNLLNRTHPVINWMGALFAPIITTPVFFYGLASRGKAKKKMNEQQYGFLVFHSYMELLPEFLGNEA